MLQSVLRTTIALATPRLRRGRFPFARRRLTPWIAVAFINFRCCKLIIVPLAGFVNSKNVIFLIFFPVSGLEEDDDVL